MSTISSSGAMTRRAMQEMQDSVRRNVMFEDTTDVPRPRKRRRRERATRRRDTPAPPDMLERVRAVGMAPKSEVIEDKPKPKMSQKSTNRLRLFIITLLVTFVVLLYLFIRSNPRACTKRECEVRVPAGDNALAVVASHLGTNCSPAEKSTAVKVAIVKTLETMKYE
jgi:hypothetical protein